MSEPAEQAEWVALDELDVDVLVYNAALALQQGNPGDAELILRHAAQRFPDDGDVQLGLADVLLAGDRTQATQTVRRAAALASGDPLRLTRAASQMYCIGDLTAARDLVVAAAAVLPEEFEYAAALAHVSGQLAEAGDDDELAERMFTIAFEGEPDHEDYGYSLARLLARRRETRRAGDIVEQSLTYNPDDEWLLRLRDELRGD